MEIVNQEVLHQGNSIITLEHFEGYDNPVVIKKASTSQNLTKYASILDNEFQSIQILKDIQGIRKCFELTTLENQPALILEYIDGETLQEHIARKTLDLRSKLEIAVDLAHILGKIHQKNLIHLDLNSKNILIGKEQQAVHFIDLSSASYIDRSGQQKVQPDQELGTLSYIAPEQTGRINRAVDERSDLYSLGVALYELMTGQLPFDSKDPMELIHHHISHLPVSPSEVSDIPEVLSAIILKLLSKNAEDRYQSAAGVQADLELCRQGLISEDTIEEFPLGELDYSSRFKFPQKLYGRESELKELVNAFENACIENPLLFFVAGYSGIGKTALVEEIQRPVSEKRGYFIRGKFDQYLRTTPYTAITLAFAEFVSQILTEPEKNFNEWRKKIQSAVGDLGKVLIEVIPTLEELLGTQPDIPQLGGQQAENRFNYVFINFLTTVTSKEHPLVLFIDDLQWIDAASLRLLKVIDTDFSKAGLLVIGAYRDNEVDNSHPLMDFINKREEKSMQLRLMRLNDLNEQHLKALLSDTLKNGEGIKELKEIIFEKTHGNPFFSRRLLTSLNKEGRIVYDSEINNWGWNIADIKSETIADNVADLLVKNIAALPEEIRKILILAACIGNRFDIHTMALISDLSVPQVLKILTVSLSGHYVFESGDSFEFVHDQVQQAAYRLMDEKSRISKHLEIGRLLLVDTDEAELEEKIFDIVTHYNLSAHLLTDQAEKIQVAELNLIAGRKARMSSAFTASITYLRHGRALLGENGWQDNYALTLNVHNELIDACYLNIEYKEVDDLFGTILDHAKQEVDLCIAYKILILTRLARNELLESISLADEYLERLRIDFVDTLGSNLSVDELLDLPPIQDKEKAAALEIMMAITSPTYIAATERLPALAFTMVDTINQYGHNHASGPAYNWYSLILCFGQKYKEANHFSRLSIELLERYPSPGIASQIMDIHYAFIRHWESSVHDLIEPLKNYYHVGMREGNYEWSLWCLLNHTLLIWSTGKPLDFYLTEVKKSIEVSRSKSQEVTELMALLFAESASNLAGQSGQTTRLEGSWFSEEKMWPGLEDNTMLLALYGLQKMTLCYLIGDPREACQYIDDLLKYRPSLNPHYLYTKISFFGGLSSIAGLAGIQSDAEREDLLRKIELFEKDLELWAEVAPMNYQHQYDLVMAEKCRISDKHWEAVQLYEQAIRGAQENQFIHDQALANELFAQFWLEQVNDRIAEMYMCEAHSLYHQWGADAKVSHLEECYPQWFKPETILGKKAEIPSAADKTQTTITQPISSIQLDLDSIISTSHMLSAETDFEQLLSKMITIVMANSGAETAVLLLKQDNDWFVQAWGDGASEKYDVLLNQPFDPADNETALVPERVFNYCQRSREVLVVGDAQSDQRFGQDRTIQTHNIKSMACIPVLNHGELKGMLYLENCQMADVFTLERLEILKHLSSQFGISAENALLYESLSNKIHEIQESESRFRSVVENANEAIVVTQDKIVKYCNSQASKLSGYSQEEIFAYSFESFIHPDDKAKVLREYNDRLSGKNPTGSYSLRIISKEGKELYILINSALINWDGKPATLGMLTDITEHKIAEKELLGSEERFRQLMEQSPLGIEIFSPEGKIKMVNSAWRKLWNVSEEEVAEVLENYNVLTDPQIERQGIMDEVKEAFKGKHTILPPIQYDTGQTRDEFNLDMQELKSTWIQCHLNSVKDAEGNIIYVINTTVDITDLRKAEEEAKEQRDVLARIDRASSMGQLTGSIAHELNQPLTGILGNAQAAEMMLRNDAFKSTELLEIMGDIVADTKRAGDVIRSLRNLYKEQKGEFIAVDLNNIINETLILLHSELVKFDVKVKSTIAPNMPEIDGNKVQIQQVLVNLIVNAIEAMSSIDTKHYDLTITTECNDKEIKVYIDDQGPGIDDDKIDHIFQPLATWKSGGTGMGLAISNSIIESHGGSMYAENLSGGGARVGFELPIIKEN